MYHYLIYELFGEAKIVPWLAFLYFLYFWRYVLLTDLLMYLLMNFLKRLEVCALVNLFLFSLFMTSFLLLTFKCTNASSMNFLERLEVHALLTFLYIPYSWPFLLTGLFYMPASLPLIFWEAENVPWLTYFIFLNPDLSYNWSFWHTSIS